MPSEPGAVILIANENGLSSLKRGGNLSWGTRPELRRRKLRLFPLSQDSKPVPADPLFTSGLFLPGCGGCVLELS